MVSLLPFAAGFIFLLIGNYINNHPDWQAQMRAVEKFTPDFERAGNYCLLFDYKKKGFHDSKP